MAEQVVFDQAAGLRRLFGHRPAASIAFAHVQRRPGSGLQLARTAHALAARGQRVVIVDEHRGNGSITAIAGQDARYDLFDAFVGNCALSDIMLRATHRITVVPAPRAAKEFGHGEVDIEARMAACLTELGSQADFLLIDGLLRQGQVSQLARAANHLAVVAKPTKTAIAETYSVIKQVSAPGGRETLHVILDLVGDAEAAGRIFRNLRGTAQKHLAVDLFHLANLGRDVGDLVDGLLNRLSHTGSPRRHGRGPLRLQGMFGPSALSESVL